MADIQTEEVQQQTEIHCPKCGSGDWFCWDERTFDCWDKDGFHDGMRVVGYLGCKTCGERWTDVSVEPGDDCECDDD